MKSETPQSGVWEYIKSVSEGASEEPQTEATPRPWQRINATVYQLDDDGLNRFSFNVQSNNRKLDPGEDEQIAALIVRAVNSYDSAAVQTEATPRNFNEDEPEFIKALAILDYLHFDTLLESVRDDACEIAAIIIPDSTAAQIIALKAENEKLKADKLRLDWLEDAVSGGYVESAFEVDGGVHLTVCMAGDPPLELREKNSIREAIDAARAALGEPQ